MLKWCFKLLANFKEQMKLFENPNILIRQEDLSKRLRMAKEHPECFVSGDSIKNLLRAISVLETRMKETEGYLWRRV